MLWEVLVPTASNEGKPFRARFHRIWDRKVRELSGGLTVMPVAKGQWAAPDGKLFAERMIPVRVLATREQMEAIVAMTLEYYDQLAVLAYKISDETILRHRVEKAARARFKRGVDPANEVCLGCGKHIRHHYGLQEYRCYPREEHR